MGQKQSSTKRKYRFIPAPGKKVYIYGRFYKIQAILDDGMFKGVKGAFLLKEEAPGVGRYFNVDQFHRTKHGNWCYWEKI